MEHDNTKKNKLIKKVKFNKYFKADSWEEYNRQFFDNLAVKYDAANKLHAFGTKNKMDLQAIDNISIPKNAKILDVCTGTGDIALGLIAKFPDAEIIGIDASEGMMKVGKSKADALGVNIKFQKGDATKLPFEDNSFDIAIISFGLRNLPTLEDGLKEMQRVVKPGGLVSNIDQGKPTNFIFHLAYKLYFCSIAPIIGKLVFHRGEFNSFKYLPESNKYFPNQKKLVEIFKELGFTSVENYNFFVGAVAQQVAQV